MNKKLVSLVATVALVFCLCATPAYGRSGSDSKEPGEKTAPAEKAQPVAKSQVNEKLKADVAKLVADAKAGKLKVPAQQFPQHKRSLSTGAKIGIIAGIGAAIIVIWVLVTLADDDS